MLMQTNPSQARKSYVHVYTGEGKGKTTAALGLALRAAGAGMKVYFAQFIKAGRYSEIAALERYADHVTVCQFGQGRFIRQDASPADRASAADGLAQIKAAIRCGRYGLVVLDEACAAIHCGLLSVQDILSLIDASDHGVEMVITGRYAPAELIHRADLVTEMKEVKHYYRQGVLARDGIEK